MRSVRRQAGARAAGTQIERNRAEQATLEAALAARGVRASVLFRAQKAFNGVWMRVDPQDLEAIASLPGVAAIHPMIPKTRSHATSVPLVGAPLVWAGAGAWQGQDIAIGVIDTGVDYLHTNFGGPGTYAGQDFTRLTEPGNLFPTAKVAGGWDFAGDAYDGGDPASVPAPDPDPMDCNGHGSHVAGSAAGLGVLPDGSTFTESAGDGYADLAALAADAYAAKFRIGPGVAPRAKIYALRVFGCDGSTNLTEQAIEWAMDPDGDNDLSDHLDVINLSLGSSFGSKEDTSTIAANNAAQAGILVVASAGNSGDAYYIAGAPGMAKYAISVANSVDAGNVFSAFELLAAPTLATGPYAAAEAAFGPALDDTGVSGDLATTTPANGCSPIGEDLTGKIALIDRGTCTFVEKVRNAQNAGAAGALIANNAAGDPFGMAGTSDTITIPSMMTTQSIGAALKADLPGGPVSVRLTAEYRNRFQVADPAREDTLSASSSRGPARGGTLLKPDLAAPGDTIRSTATGTGTQGVSFSGTSMAAPHVAGIMAILRQMHPEWSVAELKALAMNTATSDLYTGLNKTGSKYTPSRVGAGRASVASAAASMVVAYYQDDPGQVSVAFGAIPVVGARSFTKNILVSNKGASAESYTVSFDSRYQANAGLAFAVLDGAGAALGGPVTVPAGDSVTLRVVASVDPALLARSLDATIATGARQRFSEGGGYVTLTSTGTAPTLRVPVHIAARPAADMRVLEERITVSDPAGTISLHPAGIPVSTADDSSRVSISELKWESANEAASNGAADAADLRYVGVSTDSPAWTFSEAWLYFGIATHGRWDTPNAVEFDLYFDIDEDGDDDYVVYTANEGTASGAANDTMRTVSCALPAGSCFYETYVNFFEGNTNTNLFNSSALVLPVPFTSIGLADGVNTDFSVRVESYSREAAGMVDSAGPFSYDVARQSFTGVDPASRVPIWLDVPASRPAFDLAYDRDALLASSSKGLLLLHHHNAANTAEVVPWTLPLVVDAIKRAGPSPAVNPATVAFAVTFTAPVTGVDASDFQLALTGSLPNAAIAAVTGAGAAYTVTVAVGPHAGGTLRLDLRDDDTIVAADGAPLGGPGVGNGDFTAGESYAVPLVRTATLRSSGALDGWVLESAEASGRGGGFSVAAAAVTVGDDTLRRQYRAILDFNTAGLPDNAVVAKATLLLRKSGASGANPLLSHGKLLVDVRKGSFLTRPLAAGDFQAAPSRAAAGAIGRTALAGWHRGTLARAALRFVNLAGPTQVRLRFAADDDNDAVADTVSFFSGNAAAASRPKLLLQYYLPPAP